MGYDIGRFPGEVDEELFCPICSEVLEDPLHAPACEHAFCSGCIREWLSRQPTCPVDRLPITQAQLKPVPRILRSLLAKLYINCDNVEYGCTSIVKLDSLLSHIEDCEFNPKRPVICDKGCGLTIPKDEIEEHCCLKELSALIKRQTSRIEDLELEVAENSIQLNEQKTEIQLLKEFIRSLNLNDSHIPTNDHIEDEVIEWLSTLPRARVTRWGGMISTPDSMLQAVIRRTLSESGCPSHILDQLMDNAHERRWPHGLSSLETRQMNRRQYENYACKRVPGKQAVIVMGCENRHMNEDMILDPGLVMIFAHGVE